LICAASTLSAEEALAWGLVNRVVPADRLLNEALCTAERIATNAPLAVKLAKHSIQVGMQMDVHHGMLVALSAYRRLIGTNDRREGIRAFFEKRDPLFDGS
jgi:enoyl-CoA hydratase/carnithine racemase